MQIMLVKNLNGHIVAAFDQDKEILKRFKAGEPFMAEVTKPRNARFHRKAMALFNMVYQNQEIYTDFNQLRKDLTIEAGYYDEYVSVTGEIKKEAKSISFAAMDDLEFGVYYNAVIDTIVRCFHFGRQDIIDNLDEFE